MSLPNLTPGMSFDQAAQSVLRYLSDQLPMGFWSVTRVENGRQTYLFLEDNAYGLAQGGSHAWESSFCIRMAAGEAPTVAPDAQAVPTYAAAAVNEHAQIGAYAGAIIAEPDGSLFGAICGIDPLARAGDAVFESSAPLLALLGQLLTMVLAADRGREQVAGLAAAAAVAAETDVLTGLFNRRAWTRLLADEEQRFRRFGDPTVLAILDLDFLKTINDEQGHAAGDEYIRRSATALAGSVRSTDVVARLGGDEFGVLLRRCDEAFAGVRVDEMHAALIRAQVAGSIGWAPITVLRGFPAALAEADAAMYAAKRARRSAHSSA